MSLSLRLFRCVAALLFLYAGVAQAQVTVSNVTPSSVCAGGTVTFSYSNQLGPVSSTFIFLNGPGTPGLQLRTIPPGNAGSFQVVTIPADRLSGTYTIQVRDQISGSSATTAGFTVVALPAAPTTANVTYCQNAVAQALTATGQNLKWYTAASGGAPYTSITPSTVTPGTTTYYVSQTNSNGCESDRAPLTVTVNALPSAPTTTSVSYCQNVTATPLTASGQNLRWYIAASGGTPFTSITPSTSTTGTTTYYVSQTDNNGCESNRAPLAVTINPTPPAPLVANTSVVYCQNTAAQPLQATATSGNTLNWYTSQGTALGSTAPTPQTNNPGTTFYQVSQRGASGCEGIRTQITVTINTAPAAPATSPVNVCQGSAPVSLVSSVTATGTLKWYTSPTSASLAAAPQVATSTTGSQVFYVSQTNANGCESSRAAITYTVNALPNPPSVVSPVTYCQNAVAQPLQATPSPGGTLNFYTVSSGGTSTTSLTPQTQSSNNYYVSQTVNGCESGSRATITVTINAQPPRPAVTTPAPYCQFATASPLSATAATNNTLIWYALNGQQVGNAPTPATTTAGVTSYSVSQRDPLGCESDRALISVTVFAKPAAPVTSPLSTCLNTTPPALTTGVTATGRLTWYTSPTSTSGTATAPVLSASAVGSTTYYVSQTSADGCESDRTAIMYTVNSLPSPPVPTPRTVFYCQGATATPLTASGQNLKWYLTRTTSVSATSITPSTAIANSVNYYVSQTNANGCESARDSVTVITGSRPVAPTVVSPVTYCQNAVATSLSATAIPTNTLKWYGTNPAGTTFTTQATIPATTTPGTFTYYVSQTDGNSCESDKASIVVRVNPLPTIPTTTAISICQNAPTVNLPSAVAATGTLNWYAAQTGGVGSTTAPVLSTSAATTYTYYVSQTDANGCESNRATLTATVKQLPAAPAVAQNAVPICQSSTPMPLTATASPGGTLKWYDPAGNTYASVSPSTDVVATTVYRVSQIVDGCEGPTTSVSAVVIRKPDAPVVVVPAPYCQFATPTSLSATGLNLRWYADPTTTQTIPTPTPSASTPGTTTYYVTQTDLNGCQSDRASIAVQVKAKPAPPVTAAVAFCANQVSLLTATASAGGTLNWYSTNQTGGTATATAPIPSTSVTGAPVNYYVSQTVDGCESDRAAIAVTIKALPVAPTVSATPVTYCQGIAAQPLSATPAAGGTLNWYMVQTGGTASATAFTPPTTSTVPPTSYYYVSQTVDGCEGPRATIAVTINPKPNIPLVTPAVTYCQNAVTTALTATASGTLRWYTDPAGSGAIPTPTPSTTAPGVTNYYVTQTDGNGCESDRATIVVTINALPAAPVVSQSAVAVCQNSTPVALTATASAGGTLNWYTTANGTPSSTAPAPPTTTAGSTMIYYVSQTVNGCEGPKTAISVTVTPLPAAPAVITPVTYCQNVGAQPLTATASAGGSLNWYDPTGNALASAAPTPTTTTPGAVAYQVSQTVNGCAGPRASITVNVNPAPVVPTATATLAYCQSSVPPALTATASTGGTLNWYTVATGGTASSVAPTPNTTTASVQTYYVSQTVNGCESNRVAITVTINALPAAPVAGQSTVAVCQNSVPVALTATASAGGTLNWYASATATASPNAPAPPTNTVGSVTYYVSQSVNGCEGPRTAITVTTIALPAAPAVTPVVYCQNAAATVLTATPSAGGTLNWYDTNGSALTAAPTPNTTTPGTLVYQVSQTVNGCEGPKTSVTVLIRSAPAVPATTPTLAYCQNSAAPVLTATASAGGTLNWYTATGLLPAGPTPGTTLPGTQTYYVSQTVNGCESDRATIIVTIKATPAAPTVASPTISLCQGSTATSLTATPATGGALNWYTIVGGPSSPVAPTPSTNAAGTQTYYVSQTVDGCESPTTPITVTVNALPPAPVVANAAVSFCQNSASTALTALVSPGGTLIWYSAAGGTGSTTAPVPPTNTAGTQTYLVSQRVNGCEGPQTAITVTIKPLPTAPATSSTPMTYCQGIGSQPLSASPTTGGTLNWYTTAGGASSPMPPTPPTTTPGLLTYYVSQTVNGCEGPQVPVVVLIQATPAAPTAGTAPVYCQNGTSAALSAIPSAGGILNWYTVSVGGSPSPTPPAPPVATAGTVTYFVSQSVGGCEGPRLQLTATIKPAPVAPTVTPTLAYCQNSVAPALTATPTAGTLNWYTVLTGGSGSPTAPVPPTNAAGTQNYYVSQISADGCEGPRATITVTVRALPAAPTTTPVSICQNATPPSLASSVAAGGQVNWYLAQTGGTPATVPPVPATAAPGPITYYVSQVDANGCESLRTLLLVTITPTPAAPVVPTSAPVCQGTAPVVLSAAGQGLKWYADATSTGSLGSSVVVPTAAAGTYSYYVSQTVGNCEGPRTLAQVVVNATPAAPVVQGIQSGCQDATVQPLTASGTALQWYSAADELIGTPTPDTRVEATQTYSYKVSQTVAGCVSPKATVLYTVTVLPVPTVTTPVIYCQNQSPIALRASGSGLRWVDPSGAVTNVAPVPPTTAVTAGASYSVSQTNAQGCESRKAEIRVTVNAQAVAVLSGTTTISLGGTAPLTLTLSGVGPYSYTFSNGLTGVAESASSATITRTVSVTPAATTTYTLLGVSNGCGAGNASGSATVTVERPTIVTGALAMSTVCAGGRIDVPFATSGTFVPGNTFVVEVALAGDSATRQYRAISTGTVQGSLIQTIIPINYAQGLYFIRVRATNGSYPITSSPSATTLSVRALPTASISTRKDQVVRGDRAQLDFTFSGDSPWSFTYRSRTGSPTISTSTNPYSLTFTADSTTTYKLLSVTNGCGPGRIDGVDSVRISVVLVTADETPFATSVSVYPVPTTGEVTVEIDDPMLKNEAELHLIRPNGQTAQLIKTRKRQTLLNLSDEPAGTYLLQIKLGDRSTVRRVLKQ